MSILIRRIQREDVTAFRAMLQEVADERRYILTLTAPPVESVETFVGNNIDRGYPQFVATEDKALVGWADFVPREKESLRHCASLGMGVRKAWRGQGIGDALLRTATDAAINFGFTRLELEVFANNAIAIALYRKYGFEDEGLRRRARLIDGRYDDILMMGRLVGN